ncbi:MAG: glutamate--tRNA ligase [Candidatus Ornithospirochaeta sp.]|nr:glutamate--tRNA ligase [Candidatus Ornithospirochaeta sp.]
MDVRVRYAPSPTGLQHIGGIRTALFNYFFAKSQGGKFLLRVEDTDRERYTDESLQDLYDTLEWLGIKWDEGPVVGGPCGPYIQSERFDLYKQYAEQLVRDGKAYYCYCSSERLEKVRQEQIASKSEYQGYDRHCANLTEEERKAYEAQGIKPVIRLRVPTEGKTTFHDVLMGDITRKNKDVSPDPILLKSDGFPTYHLANVIDDHLMGVTHIMRAQEWIPSGPLHILLYEAFGWEPPVYCHLPMVMGKDGQKLSKRHGSTAVRDFRAKGYLPEAIINYVTLVGWSLDGSREFFTREELEKCFTMEGIHKAPAVFDYKKLDWFNGQYIRAAENSRLAELVTPYLIDAGFVSDPVTAEEKELIDRLVPSVKERMKVLSDVVDLTRFLFRDVPVEDKSVYVSKGSDIDKTAEALAKGSAILLSGLREGKDESSIEESLVELSKQLEVKVNGVFQPIRVAITNSTVSLPLFDSIRLLGLEETEKRINRSIRLFEENHNG